MRIAFSGSRRVGKSTLLESVADALTGHERLDEPYHLLEVDDHEFGERLDVVVGHGDVAERAAQVVARTRPRRVGQVPARRATTGANCSYWSSPKTM